jgi:transcription elongation GreA/GreB family factor
MAAAWSVTEDGGMAQLLTPSEHAACVRRLAELRTIRDRDIPQLLREARQLVTSDADEEIVQLRDLLAFVTARIARLEQRLPATRIVTADEYVVADV